MTLFSTVSPLGSVSVSADPSQSLYVDGDDVSLSCSAEGGPSNEFQWTLNDVNLTNETGSSLELTNITADSNGGVYTCIVSNEAGIDEDSFTVNVSPVITLQPAPVFVDILVIAMLECNASGFPRPTYQWFKVGGELSANVTGENTSQLTFNSVYYGDEGDYFCQVTSGDITINSSTAALGGKLYNLISVCHHSLSCSVSKRDSRDQPSQWVLLSWRRCQSHVFRIGWASQHVPVVQEWYSVGGRKQHSPDSLQYYSGGWY